jgi:transposase
VKLEQLRDWLVAEGCTRVAMESTGIDWRPVYARLEGHVDLIVGNAKPMKTVPGRKTDVKDCEWISDLARHGLITRSFVPARPIRQLRDLTRYRRKLSQTQATERNRLIKLLESVNIKLSGLISDVFGVSGPGHAAGADRGQADARGNGAARPRPDAAQDRRAGPGLGRHDR